MKNDLSPTQSDTGALLLPRRQFLVLGSAAVAAAAVTSLSADILRGAIVIEDKAPRLSVGFANAAITDFATPSFASRLTPAENLLSGDSSLANGVRLKVHGLIRPDATKAEDVSVGLDAMYRVAGRTEAVPFLAWSHVHMRSHTSATSGKEFTVPVSATQPLSLAVSMAAPAATAATEHARQRGTVSLSLGGERRTNKLRTGLYFVAVCPAGTKIPDWASIHVVAPENGTTPVLKHATLAGLVPVSFDYIVVATGHA